MARKQLDSSITTGFPHDPLLPKMTYGVLLKNGHPQWRFVDFAPQRAILDSSSTKLFLTHAGPSSANESIYHGVAMLAMGIYGDQLSNSMRLEAAGVALAIKKESFSSDELYHKIGKLIQDPKGTFQRNVLRLQRIAFSTSRRKELAADLIEERLYDHELRHQEQDKGKTRGPFAVVGGDRMRELRPMHLQTADMRMSWAKAHNLDICLLGLGVGFGGPVIVIGLSLLIARFISLVSSS